MFESIDYIHKDGTVERLSKLQAVQEELEPFLDDIAQQMEDNEAQKKPRKIAWKPRIYSKVESVLIKLERPMSNDQAIKIMSADELYKCYDMYCELCCWIEDKVGISYNKDKTEFCNFAGITATALKMLKEGSSPSQMEAADDIWTRLSNSLNVATENGEVKTTAGQFKQIAKSPIGYNTQVTTAHDFTPKPPLSNNSFRTVDELLAELAVMPEPKQIGSGKKK